MRRLSHRSADAVPTILFVDPEDGATGVLCDAPVALRLSSPLDPASVGPETVRVHEGGGPVPGDARILADGRLLVWRATRPLRALAVHFVVAQGLRDERGREVAPHWSRFVPCAIGREDLVLP